MIEKKVLRKKEGIGSKNAATNAECDYKIENC